MEQTGLWWARGSDRPFRLEEPPRRELGPGYTLTWTLYSGPGEREPTIRQLIYPFAKQGVIVHTPIQESVRGAAEGAGWFEALALQETLSRLGLPFGSASSGSDTPSREVVDPSSHRRPAASFTALSIGVVGALVLVLIAGRKHQMRPLRVAPPREPVR